MITRTAHRVWRSVPQPWRQQFFQNVAPLVAPRPAKAPQGGPPIGIAGLFSTASGLGEGARLGYAALHGAGMNPSVFDLSAAFGQRDLPIEADLPALDAGSGGSLVVHINAPYLPFALSVLGRNQIKGRRIIGYWAWELSQLPASWLPALKFVHEIWVPSRFTQSAVVRSTDLPVHVLPHPLAPVKPVSIGRADFGLPEKTLIVLSVFHLGSTFSRKNPLAAVAAFRRAFGDAADKQLVIKLIDPGTMPWARRQMEEAIAGASNIRVIDRTLSADEMIGLTAASDIVISMHRSEGFGLVPAEAMRAGKAVVATGWSGNLDYMNEQNSALVPYSLVPVDDRENVFGSEKQKWADPDVDAAAAWLRRLADEPDLRRRLGAKAAQDIGNYLSPARFADTAMDLLKR